MQRKIDWKLFSNNLKVFELNNILCNFDDNTINVDDEEGNNFIDIDNRIYERSTKEYKMIIDFKNNTVSFTFVSGENCCFDIDTKFEITNNDIKLTYKIDDDQKEIVIEFKEEI